MAKCKTKKCGCSSKTASNMEKFGCYDVCTRPMHGTPRLLTAITPVVYDQIGVNVCRNVDLGVVVPTTYPTATCATVDVMTMTYTVGTADTNIKIEQIPNRKNCYLVTLTNITVNMIVKLYDDDNTLLYTGNVTPVYLPTNATVTGFDEMDEDTNPTQVQVEIFAPYGVGYSGTTTATPAIRPIGLSEDSNWVGQGLNLIAVPKVLNFDKTTSTITVGVSFILESVYFEHYLFDHHGKAVIPKADLSSQDESVCLDFVEGGVLDRTIKPLELYPPRREGDDKRDCDKGLCQDVEGKDMDGNIDNGDMDTP